MAATNKAIKKMKLDYNVNRAIYDEFVKMCSKKGFSPNIVVERLMQKYTRDGSF